MHKDAHVLPFKGTSPQLGKGVYLAPGAVVIGRTTLGDQVNVWCNAVIRGDVNTIEIGAGTNIQDGCVCHVTTDTHPLVVGQNVTVGHGAILHGCTVEDGALIGMGAIVLDGAVIERGAMVAAGAVITPRTVVPAGEIWAGNPATKLRDARDKETDYMAWSAPHYVRLADVYKDEALEKSHERMQHGP